MTLTVYGEDKHLATFMTLTVRRRQTSSDFHDVDYKKKTNI